MTDHSKPRRRAIVDAHLHLYDSHANAFAIFEQRQPGLEALVGDYAALPRTYLLDAYLRDSASRDVEGIVWHEFISRDADREMAWGQQLASASQLPMALVGLVDFLDPGLMERLEFYGSLPAVTGVRQHLGWDENNPLRCFATRPDFLSDGKWREGLKRLRHGRLRCGLEVFSPQLPDLLDVVRQFPDIGFTVAVMGWPTDLSAEGYRRWRSDLTAIARCHNTVVSISAVECIFGMSWRPEQVKPWVLSMVEAFGPGRAMFGSHLPITGLSHGFGPLYDGYEAILAGFSEDEKNQVFRRTAMQWFGVPKRELLSEA
ncbi:amidohydrolase [Labrys miyagiensis]|uniref:Amidohydrolase n=1 Tax=Labrys miyagiensis TaxID=346912 RepID=A0ABQ6CC11_9HYPH|nr:amidohydrolase family protein [Labrys miyagiensis]GLS17906.1 amidohydrolase [Labrys miyagiensis]